MHVCIVHDSKILHNRHELQLLIKESLIKTINYQASCTLEIEMLIWQANLSQCVLLCDNYDWTMPSHLKVKINLMKVPCLMVEEHRREGLPHFILKEKSW